AVADCVPAIAIRINFSFPRFLSSSCSSPGLPVQVQWQSTAYFTDDSIIIPTADQILSVLQQSLDEPEDYLEVLSDLNPDNPFSTTMEAYFGTPRDPRSVDSSSESLNRSSRDTAAGMSGIIGAAAGLTVVLVGFAVYQNSKGRNGDGADNDFEDTQKLNSSVGDATVAGDTYTIDTHDGSSSSYRNNDNGQHSYSDHPPKTRTKWWSRNSGNEENRSVKSRDEDLEPAVDTIDAFIAGHDAVDAFLDTGSMSSVLSEALASYSDIDGSASVSRSGAEPLDERLLKLKQDIDDMRELGLADEGEATGRRPKSVAEIERLLADSIGEIR
ncbi:MAG: hypothetical protein SGILL_002757, partial [Bacillariaceae sp.]